MKLIASLHNCGEFVKSVNIRADRLEKDETFYYAYNGNSLVGAFDIGSVLVIFLNEEGKNEERRRT
jgi:hypothetical protein